MDSCERWRCPRQGYPPRRLSRLSTSFCPLSPSSRDPVALNSASRLGDGTRSGRIEIRTDQPRPESRSSRRWRVAPCLCARRAELSPPCSGLAQKDDDGEVLIDGVATTIPRASEVLEVSAAVPLQSHRARDLDRFRLAGGCATVDQYTAKSVTWRTWEIIQT